MEKTDAVVVTKTGLPLRLRRLTGDEASKKFWTAIMPYSWANRAYSEMIGYSWQLLLWLVSTVQLPDYRCFAEFGCRNRLYGAFLDSGDDAAAGALALPPGTVASLHLDGELCELQRLGVLEAFRGQGVGDALCRFLLSDCAARGYKRMQLGTTELQRHAINIYERLGFVRFSQFSSYILPGIPIYKYEINLENYLSGLD